MTDIENAVRTLLVDRGTAAPPDNPNRTSAVHARVRGIKRRRVAALTGGAAALATAAVLGAGLVADLARHDPVPVAAPVQPPYFDPSGVDPMVVGYTSIVGGLLNAPQRYFTVWARDGRPYLLVVRCPRPGTLTVAGADLGPYTTQPTWKVPCRTKVGSHYEGAVTLTGAQGTVLLQNMPVQNGSAEANLVVTPSGTGTWTFGLLVQDWPAYVPYQVGSDELLDGLTNKDGGTFTARLDAHGGLNIQGDCIPDVVLTFTIGRTRIGTVDCSSSTPDYSIGRDPLGKPGRTVTVTVRRSGLDTNQWRVLSVNK
jgi:hypothetical protein